MVYHGVKKVYHVIRKVYHGVRKVYPGVRKVNLGVRKVYYGIRNVFKLFARMLDDPGRSQRSSCRKETKSAGYWLMYFKSSVYAFPLFLKVY